jgi:hypothetical protein
VLPAELQKLHRLLLRDTVIESISDVERAIVEAVWPELVTIRHSGDVRQLSKPGTLSDWLYLATGR